MNEVYEAVSAGVLEDDSLSNTDSIRQGGLTGVLRSPEQSILVCVCLDEVWELYAGGSGPFLHILSRGFFIAVCLTVASGRMLEV